MYQLSASGSPSAGALLIFKNTGFMKNKSFRIFATVAAVALLLFLSCTPSSQYGAPAVPEVMDAVITRIYSEMEEEEMNNLDQVKVMNLFDEEDREVLATRHWVFDVNVPATVYIMRSTSQKHVPFWLEPAGFQLTGLRMRNDYHTYEVWKKDVDPGTVGLGINGFENFTYHYFVAAGPKDPDDELTLSVSVPADQYIGVLENGAFTYHDWTELTLHDVPKEMAGLKLLTTKRGRSKESHLTGAFRKTKFPASETPDQILLTWSADPSSSIDIQWRTDTTVQSGEVNYRVDGSNQVITVEAEMYRMEDRELMNDRYIHRFTAQLRNLRPGIRYEYRISPGTDWSEVQSFTTADGSPDFSFVWFGDVHNKPEFGELHNLALENHPETAFFAIAGDLVGDGLYRDQWDELFAWSEKVNYSKPLMNVPGNHDNRMGLGAKMYRDMFSYPKNGPTDVPEEQTYSFVYNNTLFLMLDATSGIDNQTAWIEEQLAQSDETWKIAIFHFPPYNWEEPYTDIQNQWVPLFDKYHVDLVFSGHIHYYMRSRPMKGGEVTDSFEDGTAYIISLAIPGREKEIGEEPYALVRDQHCWLYQHVRIEDNRLLYKSVNREGKIIDEFRIEK